MAVKFVFNPLSGEFDAVIDPSGAYLPLAGGTMTGDEIFPLTGFVMNDGTNTWRVTIDTSGHLVTTQIVTPTNPVTGNPIGPPPFLWMTYP